MTEEQPEEEQQRKIIETKTHHLDFIIWSCPQDPEGDCPLFSTGAFFHQMEMTVMIRNGTLPEGIVFKRRKPDGGDWLYYQGALYQRVNGKLTGKYLRPQKGKCIGQAKLHEFNDGEVEE